MLAGRILRAKLYDRALSPPQVAISSETVEPISEQQLVEALSESERDQRTALQRELVEQQTRQRTLESRRTTVFTAMPSTPEAMRVHVRGSVEDFGPTVRPGGVRSVTGDSADFGLPADATDRERRLKLAEWITVSARPLFLRVIANRLWQHHFGMGLVETSSDFGFNGGQPSHPELLDALALQLEQEGLRLKPLHRLIVTSTAYRQSSRGRDDGLSRDAGNRLLWRYSPRRIEAEVLRDSILQTAGVLNLKRGGPGFRDVSVTPLNGTTFYEPIEEDRPEFHRRTVYRFQPRAGSSTVLEAFDCPDSAVTAPQRSVTTTPLQALSLLNNGFVLAMSEHTASRAQREAGESTEAQAVRCWQLCLGRAPAAEELRLSLELVARRGLASLVRGLFNTNEFVVIE